MIYSYQFKSCAIFEPRVIDPSTAQKALWYPENSLTCAASCKLKLRLQIENEAVIFNRVDYIKNQIYDGVVHIRGFDFDVGDKKMKKLLMLFVWISICTIVCSCTSTVNNVEDAQDAPLTALEEEDKADTVYSEEVMRDNFSSEYTYELKMFPDGTVRYVTMRRSGADEKVVLSIYNLESVGK